jgi:hypothetical protein
MLPCSLSGWYSKATSQRQGDTGGPFVSLVYIPKITLLLSIATILLILLFLAAGFMMMRISSVQEQLLMARSVPRNK